MHRGQPVRWIEIPVHQAPSSKCLRLHIENLRRQQDDVIRVCVLRRTNDREENANYHRKVIFDTWFGLIHRQLLVCFLKVYICCSPIAARKWKRRELCEIRSIWSVRKETVSVTQSRDTQLDGGNFVVYKISENGLEPIKMTHAAGEESLPAGRTAAAKQALDAKMMHMHENAGSVDKGLTEFSGLNWMRRCSSMVFILIILSHFLWKRHSRRCRNK